MQCIRKTLNKMGGLQKKMKVTGALFLIGTLAISGVPLLSGFFSKDEILAAALDERQLCFIRLSDTCSIPNSVLHVTRYTFCLYWGSEDEGRCA